MKSKQPEEESYFGYGKKKTYYKDNGDVDKVEKSCEIFAVKKIVYDNQILNHPKLLIAIAEEMGMPNALAFGSMMTDVLGSESADNFMIYLLGKMKSK
jgi:hypothetical protein